MSVTRSYLSFPNRLKFKGIQCPERRHEPKQSYKHSCAPDVSSLRENYIETRLILSIRTATREGHLIQLSV